MSDAREDEWLWPGNIEREELQGTKGIFQSYEQLFDDSSDKYRLNTKTIMDGPYARAYCRNVWDCIAPEIGRPPRRILDAGCGPGVITDAFRQVLSTLATPVPELFGRDVSRTAIRWAQAQFPQCRFSAGSVHDLNDYADASFDIIHAREFYPFTRSSDLALHRTYLEPFRAKLAPGGLVVAVQIITRDCVNDTFPDLRRMASQLGFEKAIRKPLVPLRLYRRVGRLPYRAPFSHLSAAGAPLFERAVPGRLSYCFIFK